MHLTKTVVYGRYALLTPTSALLGAVLGAAMALGSWTGRNFVQRLSGRGFSNLVEGLLIVAAISLLIG